MNKNIFLKNRVLVWATFCLINVPMQAMEELEDGSKNPPVKRNSDAVETSHHQPPQKKQKTEKRTKEEQQQQNSLLMQSFLLSYFDLDKDRILKDGAQITELSVAEAVEVWRKYGWIVPYVYLIEKGADINMMSSLFDRPYFSNIFFNLPNKKYREEIGYSKNDWRRWNTRSDNKYQRRFPKYYRRITRYPNGPFMEYAGWEATSVDAKLEIIRQEMLDWLILEGACLTLRGPHSSKVLVEDLIYQLDKVNSDNEYYSVFSAIFWLLHRGAMIETTDDPKLRAFVERYYDSLSQHIIFGREDNAINDLENLMVEMGRLFNERQMPLEQLRAFIAKLNDYFVLAVAQGKRKIVEAVLKVRLIEETTLKHGLLIAAINGNRGIFEILLDLLQTDVWKRDLNRELLAASVQNNPEVLKLIIAQRAEILWDVDHLAYAFTRAARLGHRRVVEMLYALVQNLMKEKLCSELTNDFLANMMNRAFHLAILRRNTQIVEFLIDCDTNDILNLPLAEKRLRSLLANPFLDPQHEREYHLLLGMVKTQSIRRLWFASNETSYLSHLPGELLEAILRNYRYAYLDL